MTTLKSILNLRNIERVKAVIEKNIDDINKPFNEDYNPTGQTVLFGAISRKLSRHAELLIKYGADVNYKDKDGKTPLMECSTLPQDKFIIIDMLRQAGADFTVVNNFKINLLGMAIDASNFPLVKKLITERLYEPHPVNFITRRGLNTEKPEILRYIISNGFTISSEIIPKCLKIALNSANEEYTKFYLQFFFDSKNDTLPVVDAEILDRQNDLIVKEHFNASIIRIIYPYLTSKQKGRYAIRAISKRNCQALVFLFQLGVNPNIRIKYERHKNITLLELILLLHGTDTCGISLALICLKYGASPINQRKLFYSGRRQNVELLIQNYESKYPYSLSELCLIQTRKQCVDLSKIPQMLKQSIFDV